MQVQFKLTGKERLAALKMTPAKRKLFLTQTGQDLKRITAHAWNTRTDPSTGLKWKDVKYGKSQTNSGIMQSLVARPPRVTADTVSIGSNKPYARVHQIGGTIRPKNGKFLAIPNPEYSETKGKHMRTWLRETEGRGYKPYTVLGKKGGAVYDKRLRKAQAAGEDVKPYYFLVKQVKIPARPYIGFGPSHVAQLTASLRRFLSKA